MLTKIIYIRGTNGTVPTPPIQGTATETALLSLQVQNNHIV
jgi:hypothetical protein